MKTTFETIQEIIQRITHNEAEDITLDSSKESLGLDSLDEIEILIEIEQNLRIEVLDEIADKWQTVNDIVNYISSLE